MEIKLGMTIKDKVSGLSGVCLGITYYMTGCTHYGFQPPVEKGQSKLPDWIWIDETRTVIIDKKLLKLTPRKATSGVFSTPPSM